MIDLINAIMADHDQIRTGLTRIISSWQRDQQGQRIAFTALSHRIRAHVDFMSHYAHPVIELHDGAEAAIQDSDDDGQALDELVEEVEALDAVDDGWLTMVQEVEANLHRRFDRDELTIIPIMEQRMDEGVRSRLMHIHDQLLTGASAVPGAGPQAGPGITSSHPRLR